MAVKKNKKKNKITNGNGNDKPLKPLDHQIKALKKINLDRKNGIEKTLLELPSGAGKTHTIAFDVKKLKPKSILYIVHRNEIMEQTVKIFQSVCPFITPNNTGRITTGFKEFNRPYLFATIQTLSRKESLKRLDPNIEYIIIDEFHHAAARSYERVVKHVNPKFTIGLTATPYRLDGKDIMRFVDNNKSFEIDLENGIKENILVPFNYYGLYDDIDYSDIEWNGYKYSERDLNKKLLIDKRDNKIIEKFKELIGDKKTMCFCVSVKHVKRLTNRLIKAGIKCVGLSHHDDIPYRKEKLEQFRTGKYQVLLTRDLFNEGLDFPEVEGLLLLRPTWSRTVFLQQLGRGLRKRKGKKNVTVLDFIGNYHNAFEKQEWLSKFKTESVTGKFWKPEYDYKIPHVFFEHKLIDIFEEQRRRTHIPTKEELVKQYLELEKKLGRVLRSRDFREYNRENGTHYYNEDVYKKYWGSWNDFLKHMDKVPNSIHVSKDDLVKMYFNRKKELGVTDRPLTTNELGMKLYNRIDAFLYKHLSERGYKKQYIYKKFLISINETDEQSTLPYYRSKQNLIDQYFKLKKKLGRRVCLKDFGKRRKSTFPYSGRIAYRSVWGSWNDFLKSIGELPFYHPKYTKKDIIEAYCNISKKINKDELRCTEFYTKGICSRVVGRYFGSWKNFKQYMKTHK